MRIKLIKSYMKTINNDHNDNIFSSIFLHFLKLEQNTLPIYFMYDATENYHINFIINI